MRGKNKLSKFSLDTAVLRETFINLENVINDISRTKEKIITSYGKMTGEAWSGEASDIFKENVGEWESSFGIYMKNMETMQKSLQDDIMTRAVSIDNHAKHLASIVGGGGGNSAVHGIISLDWSAKEAMCDTSRTLISVYDKYIGKLQSASNMCSNLEYSGFNISGSVSLLVAEIINIRDMLYHLIQAMDNYQSEVEALEAAVEAHMNEIQMPNAWRNSIASVLGNLAQACGNMTIKSYMQDFMNLMKGWNGECCTYSGDPINMATGNFTFHREYLKFKGLYPMLFRMFYNSMEKRNGVLGKGWVHNYEISLDSVQNKYTLHLADGREEIFVKEADGRIFHYCGKSLELEESVSGYTYRSSDGVTYYFDVNGNCTKIMDKNGNYLQLTYNEKNKLAKAENNSGATISYRYDENNLLIEVSDSEGRKVALNYQEELLVEVRNEEGYSVHYEYDTQGILKNVTNPRGFRTISNEYDAQGRVTKQSYADGGEMLIDYEDEKKTIHVIEQNGNKIDYIHDERFRSVETIYEDGRIEYAYNDRNQKTHIIDKRGNKTSYGYDDRGNMNRIINPAGDMVEMEYNSARKPIIIKINGKLYQESKYNSYGKITKKTDAMGREISVGYNKNGRPIEIVQADGSKIVFEYDEKGNVITVKEPLGEETHYEYDGFGQVSASIDGNGNRTEYVYNNRGNIISVKNAEGNIRRYFYNESDKVVRIEDFNGRVLRREYNEINKPSKFIDADGNETTFEYDKMYNVKRRVEANGAETNFIYDKLNNLEKVVNAKGAWFTYEYDPNGNRTKVTSCEGNEVHLEYDAMNRLITVKDADGSVSHMEYNHFGKCVRKIDAMGNVSSYTYDDAGQKISATDAKGNVTTYHYTALGKISEIIDPIGQKISYEYLPGGLVSKITKSNGTYVAYTYDANRNVKTQTNQNGITYTYHYDVMNRIVKIESNQGQTKIYTYDALGNIETVTDTDGNTTHYCYSQSGKLLSVTNPMGNKAEYTYDAMGDICEIYQYGIDKELSDACEINENNRGMHCIKYTRDVLGHIETITDGLGNEKKYIYNESGRVIEKIDEDGFSTKYDYTKGGQLTEVLYADGKSVKLSYNPLKQLSEIEDWLGMTKIETDCLGRTEKVTDHKGREIIYLRGSMGQRTGIRYPDGKTVSYHYDEMLRLTSLRDENGIISYSYNENGNLVEKELPNGIKTIYDYNALGAMEKMTHLDKEGIIDQFLYQYNENGNKTQIQRYRRDIPQESGIYEYEYDALNRIIGVTKEGELLRSYGYDTFGNRSFMQTAKGTTEYFYNQNNQLIRSVSGDVETEYSYDKRGNMIQIMENGRIQQQYEFGANNRLARAVSPTGLEALYEYNGFGIKTSQQIIDGNNPAQEIEFIVDQTKRYNNLLTMVENGEAHNYLWDGAVVGENSQSSNHYYLQDEMGSTLRYVDEQGTSVDTYAYDEFGVDILGNQGRKQPFGFTGYQMDEVAGTYYAQARQYDPFTGRFTARDSIKGISTCLLSLNEYIYCWNQPMRYVDKDGALLDLYDLKKRYDFGCDKLRDDIDYVINKYGERIDTAVDSIFEGAYNRWENCSQDIKDTVSSTTYAILDGGRALLEIDIPGLGFDITDTWAFFSASEMGRNLLDAVDFHSDEYGVFHTDPNCWQAPFGYNSFYDFVFGGATSMEKNDNVFVVDDDGTKYTLWMWKGDYVNLGAGCETGIYIGDENGWHMSSYVDSNLYMTLQLIDQEGNVIFYYEPEEYQWWITGFNPAYQDVKPEDLIVQGTVDFSDNPDLFDLFMKDYSKMEGWCFDEESQTMYYTW